MLTFFGESILTGVAFTAGGALVWFYKSQIQALVIGVNAVSKKLHDEADALLAKANAVKNVVKS